jgi:hypothetical protein
VVDILHTFANRFPVTANLYTKSLKKYCRRSLMTVMYEDYFSVCDFAKAFDCNNQSI